MNVNAILKRLGGKTYTVTRQAAGAYSATTGLFVPGSNSTLNFLASVQPLDGEELLSIPEGDRARERFRFFSASLPKLASTERMAKGDHVSLDGVAYEIEKIAHWPIYSKAILARVNTDAN